MTFSIFNFGIINAQYFWHGSYTPVPCYEQDSITIIDTVSLGGLNDYKYSTSVNIIGDSIFIRHCYIVTGGPQISYPFGEITNIGKLNKGVYIVKIEGTMSASLSCTPVTNFINSVSFPLEVIDYPNGLLDQSLSHTPFGITLINNSLKLYDIKSGSSISIFDLQGKNIYKEIAIDKSININTANWSNGVYFISVESNGERKRWKVLKE